MTELGPIARMQVAEREVRELEATKELLEMKIEELERELFAIEAGGDL